MIIFRDFSVALGPLIVDGINWLMPPGPRGYLRIAMLMICFSSLLLYLARGTWIVWCCVGVVPCCWGTAALFLRAFAFEVTGGRPQAVSRFARGEEPGSSAVVVGNGPSMFQQRLGDVIDQFDVVVRLEDYSLLPKDRPYVGSKTSQVWTGPTLYPLQPGREIEPERVVLWSWNVGGPVTRALYLAAGPTSLAYFLGMRWRLARRAWRLARDLRISVPGQRQFAQALSLLGLPRLPVGTTVGFAAVLFQLQRHGHVHIHGLDAAGGGSSAAHSCALSRTEAVLIDELVRMGKVRRLAC